MRFLSSNVYPPTWAFKKDIPAAYRHLAVKVQFPFAVAWIIKRQNEVLMTNDTWATIAEFWLRTPGHVIGYRDLTSADGYPWAAEWRAALSERIAELTGG